MATSIVTYNDPESNIAIDLPLDTEARTTWINQRQLAQILDLDTSVISRHVTNYKNERGEQASRDIANFTITASDGKKYAVEHYNITIAVYVGFRAQATMRVIAFQDWVGKVLDSHLSQSKALTPMQQLEAQLAIMKDHERQLTDHEMRLTHMEENATGSIHEFTVVGYFIHCHRPAPTLQEARTIGLKATKLSRELGYTVTRTADPRFGEVNLYHEDVLRQVLK